MSAFDTAFETLFSDSNLAVEATFIPLQGTNKQVRIITNTPDIYQNIGQSVIETPTFVLEVRVSDCPVLVEGDQFLIGTSTYKIQGVPKKDGQKLVWQADCFEV